MIFRCFLNSVVLRNDFVLFGCLFVLLICSTDLI